MAATEKKNIYPLSAGDGVAPEIETRRMAASQGIFMPNAPGYFSQAGTVKLSDTSDATGDTHHCLIVGVEDKSIAWPLTAELDVDTKVRVIVIRATDKFVVFAENNGSDSAVATSVIGDQYGLVVSTSAGEIGYTTVDFNEAADVVVQVVGIYSDLDPETETTSTSPGRVVVQFLPAVIDAVRA